MNIASKTLRTIFPVAYFAFGLLQLAATYAGVTDWLGWHWLVAGPVSLIVGYVAVLGTVTGICGAHYGWQWSWGASVAVFFAPMLMWLLIGASMFFSSRKM
jgi:hypothetical protein